MADLFSSASRRPVRPLWILLAASAIAGTAGAAEAPATAAEEGKRRGFGLRIDRERLVPHVSTELESFTAVHRAAGPGNELRDHVLFEEMTRSVRRGAKRVTRKAVKNYLLETINLDQKIDHVRAGIRGPESDSRRMRFSFGFHSALPEVGVRTKLGQGSVRLRVGAEGDVGIHLRNNRFERAEVSAFFDGDETVNVRARLAF